MTTPSLPVGMKNVNGNSAVSDSISHVSNSGMPMYSFPDIHSAIHLSQEECRRGETGENRNSCDRTSRQHGGHR